MSVKNTPCAACGMQTQSPAEYHPFVACELFKHLRDSRKVRANLRAVVEYGMAAQREGVSLDDAMRDLSTVHTHKRTPPPPPSIKSLARKIAADLFTNGAGEHARRLVLELEDGRNGGGWGELPAADRIAGVLARAGLRFTRRARG